MKTLFNFLFVFAIALGAFWVLTPSVLAAAPANDTIGNATLVSLGFSELLDTTEATTDSDDAQLNSSCGAPATDASVWYVFTTSSDAQVVVDVSPSNYSAGILVGVGDPGNLQTITCGASTVTFSASAGTTYYVLAIDDQNDGSGNGGMLSISFNEIPPPPTVEITVNSVGEVNPRTGVAKISGTYTCSNGYYVDIYVSARQNVGRFSINGDGYFFDFDTCDEVPHKWTTEIFPYSGKFAGGKAMTVTNASSCGIYECSYGYAEQTVMLRGVRK